MLTNLNHANHEARLLLAVMASSLMLDMVDPMMLIMGPDVTAVARAALATGHLLLIVFFFGLAAALILPFLVVQLFCPAHEHRNTIIRTALLGLCGGGIVWMYLAYVARPLDYQTVAAIFARNGIWNIFLAAVLAYRLNYQQQSKHEEPPCTSV